METAFEDSVDFSETCTALGLNETQKISSETPRVVAIIASILESSISKEEISSRIHNRNVTIFHGSKAPVLGLKKYIERIFKYTNCSTSCFVVGYIYIQRYIQKHSFVCLTSLNVHRLLITSIMIAAKFLDDEFENNAHYALVGGVSTSEINELEMELLFKLEFKVHVTMEVFDKHCKYLIQRGSHDGMREDQVDHRRSRGHRGRIENYRSGKYENRGCTAM